MDYKALYEQQLQVNLEDVNHIAEDWEDQANEKDQEISQLQKKVKKVETSSNLRQSKIKKLQVENKKLKQESLDDHKKLREYMQRVTDKFGSEEAEPLEPQYYETCDECNVILSIDTPINIFEHPKKDNTICVCSCCADSMYHKMKKKGWIIDDEDQRM